MKQLNEIKLSTAQSKALDEIRKGLNRIFAIEALVLYGSVARGEADKESDVDLLIITSRALDRPERHRITGLVFDVNLRHDTNFSSLAVDHASWEAGLYSVLPIRQNIERDGVLV